MNRRGMYRYGRVTSLPNLSENGPHDSGEFAPSYIPRFTTPDEYINARIEILRDHLYIPITDEDIAHIREFKTEGEINAAIKGIINKYWR